MFTATFRFCPLSAEQSPLSEQQTCSDSSRQRFQLQQNVVSFIFVIRHNVDNHITQITRRPQILRRDINTAISKDLVDAGQQSRAVFVDMQQTVGILAMHRQ